MTTLSPASRTTLRAVAALGGVLVIAGLGAHMAPSVGQGIAVLGLMSLGAATLFADMIARDSRRNAEQDGEPE